MYHNAILHHLHMYTYDYMLTCTIVIIYTCNKLDDIIMVERIALHPKLKFESIERLCKLLVRTHN